MASPATALLSRYPWVSSPFIVSAPMRVMSGPALAVSVSQAGGLGFLGPRVKTEETLADLEEATSLVAKAAPQHGAWPANVLPVGVGFQLWSDDSKIAAAAVEKFRPCAAWLYAPRDGQRGLDEWSRLVRRACPETQVWVQVGTLAEVKELLLRRGEERPDVVRDLAVGRGGIADGRGVAAAICLGASGAAMGTRFLAAREARISRGYQNEVVRAADGAVATTRTLLYNHLRGTFGWPQEYSPRTIINRSYVEQQEGKPFEDLQVLHDQASKAGDAGWGPQGRLATYAGASVGLIHDVQDAATIVHDAQRACRGLVR
ncbi:inosine monophosphate dehydrogenase [Aspergillus campestris IBT 28561]|uniref:Inosine monophosphate dehydrogenase n=1 Tax=Aspergillus campestris (strain IBT 28561) TaxID=1392248 RepID=A0A2I1CUQ5_ASPC2|nr:inosine monophosphate dehydrogenase [Aspergillus campestris IBT 28561]PKY01345.1 inosine monophosphate dehydrogenase [Aspergillus campestris IBT 28561]